FGTNGSRVRLAWQTSTRWDQEAPVVANPSALTAVVTYPIPVGGTDNVTIVCRKVTITSNGPIWLIDCEFDGDIHEADSAVFNAPEGWLQNETDPIDKSAALTNQSIANESQVDYPKPIVSWDIIPHQVLGDDQNRMFTVSLLAA
ncbi:MAG: hypothetical protein ACR2GY_00700, partial [Phycisphaerales bacterium]